VNRFPNPLHMRSLIKACWLVAALLPFQVALGESDWISLFNGKNLDGWTERNRSGSFHVEDGAIVGTATTGLGTTPLCTSEEFGNFDLEFECKLIEMRIKTRKS